MDVPSYSCPACGARVGELTRRCTFCHAPVATLRCGACFHMNVPDAIHCSGCGWDLGLEPVTEPGSLVCPSCGPGHTLSVVHAGSGDLHDCATCGGQLVPHGPLRAMLESREWVGSFAQQHAARAVPADVRVHYVACPCCAKLMARKNFSGKSGVIIDICRDHGVWFDAGELPRVLAFVRSGGLKAKDTHDDAVASLKPTAGVRYTAGVEHREPVSARGESYDGVASLGGQILDHLLDNLLGPPR